MKEQPIYEIWNPETGKRFKLYASGRVEGLCGWKVDDKMVTLNLIPLFIAKIEQGELMS